MISDYFNKEISEQILFNFGNIFGKIVCKLIFQLNNRVDLYLGDIISQKFHFVDYMNFVSQIFFFSNGYMIKFLQGLFDNIESDVIKSIGKVG